MTSRARLRRSVSAAVFMVAVPLAGASDLRQAVPQPPAQPAQQPPAPQPAQQPPAQQPVPQPVQQEPLPGVAAPPVAQPVVQQPIQPALQSGQVETGAPVNPVRGERTFRGLFGGTAVGPGEPGLSATFAGYAGHDDDLRAAQTGGGGQGRSIGGNFAGGTGLLEYSRPGEKLVMDGNFAADFRHYVPIDRTTRDFLGNFAFDAGSTRTRFGATQMIEYGSLFRFSALPGLGAEPGGETAGDYAYSDSGRLTSSTMLSVRHSLDTRSTLSGHGGYTLTVADGTEYDRRAWRAGGAYVRQMTNRLTLNLGYDYQEQVFGAEPDLRRTIINSLNVGVGYVWPLSFSRRTTVAFGGGTGRISREVPGAAPTDVLRATGVATITHLMGRTWTLEGNYSRGMQFVELFPDPFFVDTVRVTLDGMMSRRLEFRALMAYADGQFQFNTAAGTSRTTATGTARLGYAFNEALELAADYAYYYYDYSGTTSLPVGLAPVLDRQSFRVSLRYWVPLLMTR